MSWSTWQRYAPVPPPSPASAPVWSSVNHEAQVCTELQRAPDACSRKILGTLLQGTNDVQPQSCISRGYTRQMYDPELLQSSYMFQTQSINSPCNVQHPIYIVSYMP
jgi:hypothetical protein